MKRLLQFSALFFLVLSLNSCGYTTNTGGSKAFSKKHYNRGIVKQKSVKKDNKASDTEKLAFDKKAKKHVKMHVEQFAKGQELTASTELKDYQASEKEIKKSLEYIVKESLEVENIEKKESKKILKKFNKILKFSLLHFKDMESSALPSASSAPAAGAADVLSLISGILGIVAFTISFIPIIGLIGLPLAIGAIVLGIIGLAKGTGRRGWAITGIVLGALALLIWILFISIFAGFFIAAL